MAYYLDNPSNNAARIETTSAVSVGNNVGDYVEFSGFANTGNERGFYRIIGQRSGYNNLIELTASEVLLRADSNSKVFTSGYTQPSVGTDFIIRFERYSAGWECFLDGVSLGQVAGTETLTFNAFFDFNSRTIESFLGACYYIEASTNGGVSVTNYWDSSASNGTGSTLPDTAGTNDGTLVDFPTDDSQWVFYDAGGAVTLLPNFISSDELVYNHTVSVGPPPSVTLLPNFISSSEALYLPTLLTSISTTPDFIVSSESFYLPQISPGTVTITPDNILTGEIVYPPSTLTDGVVISPDTILTNETVYLHSVSTSTSVNNVQFIFSEEDIYALHVAVGQLEDVFILDRIASNEEFYAHNIVSGEVFIQLQALIASGELFYNNRVYDPSSSLLAVGITDRLYEALYSYKGTVNDKLFAYLRDQSLTGTLSDMIAGYGGWKKLLKDLSVIQTL